MDIVPILLAVAGLVFLVWEIWALAFIRRAFKTDRLPLPWRRRRTRGFVIGAILVLTIPWQAYPLGDGTAAGIPFFAAWYDAKGRDFIGAITLPALMGNAAVWFLLPQLVLVYRARRYLSSAEASHADGT
jgi:hypothetical protein